MLVKNVRKYLTEVVGIVECKLRVFDIQFYIVEQGLEKSYIVSPATMRYDVTGKLAFFFYNGDNVIVEITIKQKTRFFSDSAHSIFSAVSENKLGGNSIQINYLLRGKLYCGYCGHRLNGESGTSHT